MTEQEQNSAKQNVKRWTAKRKAALVLDLIKGTIVVPNFWTGFKCV